MSLWEMKSRHLDSGSGTFKFGSASSLARKERAERWVEEIRPETDNLKTGPPWPLNSRYLGWKSLVISLSHGHYKP